MSKLKKKTSIVLPLRTMSNSNVDVTSLHESDFKSWILYTFPGEVNSEKALARAQKLHSEVYVQDIRQIPSIPSFVSGVPTLIHKKENRVYTGTHAIQMLDKLAQEELQPAPVATGYNNNTGVSRGRTFEGAGVVPVHSHVRYDQDETDEDTRLSEDALSVYMQRRDTAADMALQKMQARSNGRAPGGDRMPSQVAHRRLESM